MPRSEFEFKLVRKPKRQIGIPIWRQANYCEQTDSILSLLQDVCDAIADADLADFVVIGFGRSPWPLDVHTDLVTVFGGTEWVVIGIKRCKI